MKCTAASSWLTLQSIFKNAIKNKPHIYILIDYYRRVYEIMESFCFQLSFIELAYLHPTKSDDGVRLHRCPIGFCVI